MSSVVVHPAARVRGRVPVPGDKSISHRYALLAALAEGRSTIDGYAPGADCASTLACLRALGVRVDEPRSTGGAPGRPGGPRAGRGRAGAIQRARRAAGRGAPGGLRPGPRGGRPAGRS